MCYFQVNLLCSGIPRYFVACLVGSSVLFNVTGRHAFLHKVKVISVNLLPFDAPFMEPLLVIV